MCPALVSDARAIATMLTIATVWKARQPESFDIAIDSLAIVSALGWGDKPDMGRTVEGISGFVNNLIGTAGGGMHKSRCQSTN